MRIAVVGPTHPFKGGVAQHTTALAHRLREAGHETTIVTWRNQYPGWLYPGEQYVEEAEFAPFADVQRLLSWNRPDSWWGTARRLRHQDLVIFAHTTPAQVPPYWLIARYLRWHKPRTVVICHNVLPHERSRVDVPLVKGLLRACDGVVVHSPAEAKLAQSLTGRPVTTLALAPFMPDAFVASKASADIHRRLLFFGLVRPYKGVDLAIRALAESLPDVQLRIAGEFWISQSEIVELSREIGVASRVEIRAGYVAANEVPRLFDDVDALLLPYRSATGSQGVWTAFQFGVPAIVTRVGHLADDVRDGIDGLVVEPNSVPALVDAIRRLYEPGAATRMRQEVKPVDASPYWHRYLDGLLTVGSRSSPVDET